MKDTKDLQKLTTQIRRDIVRMVHGCQSGHPGGSLGCADFLTVLYFNEMKINPDHFSMDGKGEDLFFLSNGHISPVFYSVLARRGYFPVNELSTFRKLHSRLQGHPTTHEGLPGVRMSSGSLGQGLSVAIGAAYAKKLNGDNTRVFVLMGDGEQQEGQVWEAVLHAGSKKVSNLIAAIDYNGQQIDGPVEKVMDLGNLKAKYEAFGWDVIDCNGHDLNELQIVLASTRKASVSSKPRLILLKTEMGKGIDFMEGTHKWHGAAPNDEQLAQALNQLTETLDDY